MENPDCIVLMRSVCAQHASIDHRLFGSLTYLHFPMFSTIGLLFKTNATE